MESGKSVITEKCVEKQKIGQSGRSFPKKKPSLTFEDRLAKAREVQATKANAEKKVGQIYLLRKVQDGKNNKGTELKQMSPTFILKGGSKEKVDELLKNLNGGSKTDGTRETLTVRTRARSSAKKETRKEREKRIQRNNEKQIEELRSIRLETRSDKLYKKRHGITKEEMEFRLAVIERLLDEVKRRARMKSEEDPDSSFLNGFSVRRSEKKSSQRLSGKSIFVSSSILKELEERLTLQQSQMKTDSQEISSTSDFPMKVGEAKFDRAAVEVTSCILRELEKRLTSQQSLIKTELMDIQESSSVSTVGSSLVQDVVIKTEPLEFLEEAVSDPYPVELLHASDSQAVLGGEASNSGFMVMDIEIEPDESVESSFSLEKRDVSVERTVIIN